MFDTLKCRNCGKSINIKETKEFKNELEGIKQKTEYYSQIIENHKNKIHEIELLIENEDMNSNQQLISFLEELKKETVHLEELINDLKNYESYLKG
jgi:Mg2+ and Co2+ transporter CorA